MSIVVQIGPATRAISADYGSLSPDWLTPQFDPSFWKPVRRIDAEAQRCVVRNREDWQGIPMYMDTLSPVGLGHCTRHHPTAILALSRSDKSRATTKFTPA